MAMKLLNIFWIIVLSDNLSLIIIFCFNYNHLDKSELWVVIKSQSNTDLSDATDFNRLLKIFNLY
jgi:hypothetical protein